MLTKVSILCKERVHVTKLHIMINARYKYTISFKAFYAPGDLALFYQSFDKSCKTGNVRHGVHSVAKSIEE